MQFSDYKSIFNKIINDDITAYQNQYDIWQLLCDMREQISFNNDDVRKYAMKISKYAHEMTAYQAQQTGSGKYDELYWRFLLLEAPWLFDSYLMYLERKRIECNKFYEPKKEQLNKHGLIQAMQDLEDDVLNILSISMPPGTQKTTLEKFFASWVIGKHPDDYNLFYSHSGDITRMFYDGVLDITTNNIEYCWNEIFPTVRLKSTDAKREQINFNSYKPFANLQCSSVGAKNAGKVRANRYLFCDDLIGGIEEALSKPRLDKLWGIYAVDARQRKLNQDVKEIHISTRWSTFDIISRLMRIYEGNDKCRFISIPDIDPVTGESNFNYKYNGMTVEFFHDQELAMDEISYRCLYKNEPIEREGLLYHEDELRRYLELPLQKPDVVLSLADTKNKGSDYFFQPVFYIYGNDYYLVDTICNTEADYEVQYSKSVEIIKANTVDALRVESNNGGSRVAFEINKRLKDDGYFCNVTENYTTKNKETKIIVFAPWVKQHILFKDKSLYNAKDDYGEMMSQLLRYSTVGKNSHDDVPDGLAMFAEWRSRPEDIPTKIVGSLF